MTRHFKRIPQIALSLLTSPDTAFENEGKSQGLTFKKLERDHSIQIFHNFSIDLASRNPCTAKGYLCPNHVSMTSCATQEPRKAFEKSRTVKRPISRPDNLSHLFDPLCRMFRSELQRFKPNLLMNVCMGPAA